jgi:peptide chain release factor subunit 1
MAATVSWEGLRELAGFRAEKGRAISFYLNLDPRVSPTAGDVATRVNSLLDDAGKRTLAARTDLTHDQRVALKGDLDRIRRYFELEFSRDGARGLAVFSDALDNFWRPLPLTSSVDDEIKVNDEFYLTPLVPLIGRGEGALVAVIGRERGELYRLRGGRLEEIADRTEEQPGRHDQGGWSQARFQRHIENRVASHLRRLADDLETRVRRQPSAPVVIVSSEETRAEFTDMLSVAVKHAVVGWTQAEAHAAAPELLELARPVLERWYEQREQQALARWREEAGRHGRAASGWAETLEAASDGRVELLLYQQGVEHDACRCPACGRLSLTGGKCPLDGTELEHRDEGLDLAIHQTIAHGGTVFAVMHRPDLGAAEGIGALLRY